MFVSMNRSNARIFPSNLTSHNGENINEISQSILIVSLFVTSPLSFRFRALAKRFRRRFRTSSNVEIRKISLNDSTPWNRNYFSISEMNPIVKHQDVHDKQECVDQYQQLNSIHVVYFVERLNLMIEHELESKWKKSLDDDDDDDDHSHYLFSIYQFFGQRWKHQCIVLQYRFVSYWFS